MLVQDIINEASAIFNVHRRDIVGPYRYRFLIPCRFALYYALRERGASLATVGRWMQRDHSSVIHGIERAKDMIERDQGYAKLVQHLIEFGRSNGQSSIPDAVERRTWRYVLD